MREIDELTLPENNRASVSPVSVEAAVDSVIQGRNRRQARVLFNLDDARNTNPDQENVIRKNAAAVGMPVDAARAFPDDAARRANALRLQKMRLAQNFPHTMAFFEDINNARIAHDDIDNLKETESVFTNISDFGRSFSAGIVSDFLGNIAQGVEENILRSQYGAMSELQAMTGGDELSQSGIADEQGREAVMGTSRFIKKDIGEYIDIPKERRNRLRNQIARGLGQVAGQIALMAATGGYGGMFFLGMQGSGQMSESLAEDRKRLLEKGINPSIAGEQAAFLGGSAVTALTEKFGLDFMTGKYTPALIRLAEKYGAPAIMKMIENRGVRFATGALLAGLGEGSQEVTEDLGQTWLRTALVDRSVQVPDAEQLWDEFLVGGLVGLITHGAVNARSIIKSRENKRVVEAATDTAARAKLNERDSEAYGKYFKGVAEDSKADGAFIRKDAWDAYYQGENMDPARAAERYGITNYSEAAESGAYLEMPLERHGSDFAKTDAAIKLKDHTKYFADPEVVTPYELALLETDQARIDRELQKTLADINATHGKRQNLEDAIDAITEDVSAQLQARWGESTSNTQATLVARWFSVSRMRDELSRDPEATDEKIIRRIADEWQKKGLNIRANVLPAILTKRKSVDISIDPMLEKLRRNELPKESDVYGQSLMEYIRKKGGLRPDDITRDLVRNRQLPRSILNEKGMGADELASLPDVLDFGLDTETTQGDNALLDALVAEYTTGEKRYSNAQLNSERLSEAQALNDLSRDLAAVGIDLSTNTDNAAVREALSKYYEEQNGENTREESETSETERYEQRGFDESAEPTAEEKLKRDVQNWYKKVDLIESQKKKPSDPVPMLRQTPLVMHLLGADFREIYAAPHLFDGLLSGEKLGSNHNIHPNITAEILKQVPEALADPVAVFKSATREGRLVFMLDVRDANGATVVVPIELNARKDLTAVVHMATSAYSKDSNGVPNNAWFARQAKENALYINRKKEKRWTETSSGSNSLWVKSNASEDNKLSSGKRVLTEDDLVKLKQNYPSYYQYKQRGKVRGATIIHPDRTMRIELFKDADFSTFAHETAHFMLEDFADMAMSENASQYAKDEFARICRYLNADPAEKFTREQHEKFAQSFEKYLMEGKAPSLELKDIFRKFRTWLQDIYRVLKLHVTLSKDIRDVFDRMLATDREIEVARSVNQYADTLFATAKNMGVSPEVFEAYKKQAIETDESAREIVLSRLMRVIRQEKTETYQRELATVKEQIRKAYEKLPAAIAKKTLGGANSTVKLNRDDLVARYGKSWLNKLPRNGLNRLYVKEGGIDADSAAELLGYPSGDAMLEAITTLPSETEYVNAEAERIMRERYGDLLNSDYLPDLAQEALHSMSRLDMLLYELYALRRHEKESLGLVKKRISLAREAARQFAQRTIDEKSVRQIRPYSYLQAARKASREAFDFVAEKQYDKAAEAKYRELISTALYSEAVKARSDIDSDRKLFSRILSGSEKKLAKTRSMNPVYRARYILARHGIGNRADYWLEKLQTAGKYENVNATAEPSKDWREMSFSEFAAMADEVKGLWELSRRDKVVEIDGKRLEVAAVAENIRDEIEKFGVADEEHVEKTGISKLLDDWSTSTKRVEQQFDMIGGEDGVLMTKVFQPMKDAAVRARLKQTEVMDRMQVVISKLKFKPGKIIAPELIDKETGRPHVFGRGEICGAAEVFGALLHTGNESNSRKLLLGRGWATTDAEGRMNTSNWNAFIERMVREGYITKAHYDAAQAIWDEFESLKPLTQKANKAIYGTWFKEIGIDGIVTPFGQYKGGYVPAKTDKNVVPDAQLNELKDVDTGKVQSMMPLSQPGFTKSRSETYAEALDMNPRTIIGATNRIISFAYIAPVYNDVRKILQHDSVKNAMHRYDPRFLRDVISPWMNRARQQTATTDLNDPSARRWATLRSRAGAMFMFNNVKNVVQSSADFLVAASEVKPGNLMAAVLNHDRKAIAEKSEYMRSRFGKSQIAMMDNIDSILIDAGTLKKADRWLMQHAYWMQQLVDDRMSTITWTAAYNDAIQDGKSELQAIRHADRIVRKVFASQNAEDVSNIEAGTAFKRLFTQFSGFFVVRSNLVATELGKIAREAGAKGSDSATTKALKILSNKKMKVAILLLTKIVVPAIVDTELALLLKGLMPGDDDWMREMFIGSAGYVSGLGGPYANLLGEGVINVANVATGGRISSYDSRLASAPAISILEDVLKQSALIAKGGITPERIMKLGTDLTVMPVAPVVPMQVTRQAVYLAGVAGGKIKPTGGYDFIRGMVTGRASADSRR